MKRASVFLSLSLVLVLTACGKQSNAGTAS
jgi:hypothetical protein